MTTSDARAVQTVPRALFFNMRLKRTTDTRQNLEGTGVGVGDKGERRVEFVTELGRALGMIGDMIMANKTHRVWAALRRGHCRWLDCSAVHALSTKKRHM